LIIGSEALASHRPDEAEASLPIHRLTCGKYIAMNINLIVLERNNLSQ